MLSPDLIDDPTRLRDLSAEWAELVRESAAPELTLHPDWMLPWWDVFGAGAAAPGGRSLRTLAFRGADGRLVGLAPLLGRRSVHPPGIPFRRLEMLASGEDEADETCSDYLGVIAAKGAEGAVAEAFASALAAGTLGAWDELVLPSMNGESVLPRLLESALVRRGLRVSLEERSTSPYVALPPTWDEYLAQLKGSKRAQLRKALRALESWAGGPPVIERVRTLEQLEEGKLILEALHKERWGSDGVYRSARYRAFHDRAMPLLLAQGALDLGWLRVRGEPVAAFYNLRYGGRICHYQSGRKLDTPDDVRVGVTMHALLVRAAIEDGLREYDFLGGAAQYKMALASATRPLVTLRAARPSAREWSRAAAERATGQVREVRDFLRLPSARRTGSGSEKRPAEPSRIARALDDRTRPLFFGPESRALFGWYHPPAPDRAAAAGRRAIVLCPPLGYEAICAHPALRTFAERLAAAGHPVLRFDYDGTGDAAGLDTDPGRVRAWIEGVGHAVTEIRALSGAREVCLLGTRMGGTLALAAASARADVEQLVLFNPCPTGKAYVREMKAFRMFAEQSGELAARPKVEGDESEESGGFLFTKETLAELKALDGTKLALRASTAALVIGRDDVPDDEKLARAMGSQGAAVAYQRLGGYAEMMVAPHKSVFPEAVFEAVLAWLGALAPAPIEAASAPAAGEATRTTARAEGVVTPGVQEEPIRFGPASGLFGILTQPAGGAARDRPLIVFSNTAGNYRIGPNRMYVGMARRLATLGFASVRIDVSGIGDSLVWEDDAANHPYADRLFDDVRAVIQHLRAEGRAERFGIAGLCSGAFVAYHTAVLDPAVTSVVLVNLQIFAWEEGMSLEVNPLANRDQTAYYKRRLFAKDAWMKMLRGGVDVGYILGVAQRRVLDSTRATVARAKAKLSADASRGTPIARAFDALGKRGVDVLVVFSGGDPGIDNLNEKIGASMGALKKQPGFTIEVIDGVDHSFTPVWSQTELDRVVVAHLAKRFA